MSILGPISQAVVRVLYQSFQLHVSLNTKIFLVPGLSFPCDLRDYVSQRSRTYAKMGRYECESEGVLVGACKLV